MRICSRIASAVFLASFLFGCGDRSQSSAAPAPPGSSVSIIGIDPSTEVPLRPGERVRVSCKVAYVLTAESGKLALFVQDTDGLIASTSSTIKKGHGNEEFVVEFVVPANGEVNVFVPLAAANQDSTTTVSHRASRVLSQ